MKAEDTITIDLRNKSSIADYMVVTSGRSNRHVGSVADRVLEDLDKAGIAGVRVEGMPQLRLGIDRRGRRDRPRLPTRSPRLLQSREDVGGRNGKNGTSADAALSETDAAHHRRRRPAEGRAERDLAERYRDRVEKAGRASVFATSKSSKSARAGHRTTQRRVLEESIALANAHPRRRRHGGPRREGGEPRQRTFIGPSATMARCRPAGDGIRASAVPTGWPPRSSNAPI